MRGKFLTIYFSALILVLSAGRAGAQYYEAPQTAKSFEPVITFSAPRLDSDLRYIRTTYSIFEDASSVDYDRYRALYAGSSYYDPLAVEVLRRMQALAKTYRAAPVSRAGQEALMDYNTVVMDHMANLAVVNEALLLSSQDDGPQDGLFGKSEILRTVRSGLLQSVLSSGTGKTLIQAYKVISPEEELALSVSIGLDPAGRESVKESSIYYNMYEGTDPASARPHTVFVNTSRIMRWLEQKRGGANKPLDLRY